VTQAQGQIVLMPADDESKSVGGGSDQEKHLPAAIVSPANICA